MKKLVLLLTLLTSLPAFSTQSYVCSSSDGSLIIRGQIGAGGILQKDIFITHSSLAEEVSIELAMGWIDVNNQSELKLISYDPKADLVKIDLIAEDGYGVVSLNLLGVKGAQNFRSSEVSISCDF